MPRWMAIACMLPVVAAGAVLLDRIAIVVNNQPIKDSDIERDIRVTALLNGDRVDTSPAARKQAANRLIDQALIRREMEVAAFPQAKPEETEQMIQQLRKQRLGSDAVYRSALEQYGVTDAQLRRQLDRQVTVLHFIEQRFRPGVLVSEEDIQKYFEQHQAELRQRAGDKPVTLADARDTIEEQLTGERVNQQFFGWLDEERKDARIQYLEPELK
jgi:peptidyl-prolyl cis-trans isomerase SurA